MSSISVSRWHVWRGRALARIARSSTSGVIPCPPDPRFAQDGMQGAIVSEIPLRLQRFGPSADWPQRPAVKSLGWRLRIEEFGLRDKVEGSGWGRDLRGLLFFLGLILLAVRSSYDTLTELTNGAAHLSADLAQAADPEDQDDDHQDDDQFNRADIWHTALPLIDQAAEIVTPFSQPT